MFEQYTFENLLQEMIDETSPEFDVSETSPLYSSYAMSAAQTAKFYRNLNRVVELGFASTSEDEYLEKRTSELGVFPMPSVAALRRGQFNISVPLGSRFFVQDLYFEVVNIEGNIQLQCETPGVIGNTVPVGTEMLPLETIEGLEYARLGDVIIPGSEKETDGSLFVKYQEKAADPSTSGNAAHYREWVREIEGVGDVKVFPGWDGLNSVKLVIVNTDHMPASTELVEIVQKDIDPVPGQGEGLAPAGAFVTVESAASADIDVSVNVELASSTTSEFVQVDFTKKIEEYLKSISFKEDIKPIIRYRVIGSMLLDIPGVLDYSNLLINDQYQNITLKDDVIPVVGQVSINV